MPRICKPIQGVSLTAGVTTSDTDRRICLPKIDISPIAGDSGQIIIYPGGTGAVSYPGGTGLIVYP